MSEAQTVSDKQLDWLLDKTVYGYHKLNEGTASTVSLDAALEAAQHLAVTVFIQAARATQAACQSHRWWRRHSPHGREASSSPLPQTGDYVAKPRNVSAYCGCDHECWQDVRTRLRRLRVRARRLPEPAWEGVRLHQASPADEREGADGRPTHRTEGRWRWVEA